MSKKWFAAHVLMYVQFKNEAPSDIPVWENIYLLSASSEDEAFEKAEKLGRAKEGDENGTFRWDDKEASWAFGGVRKVTYCQNADQAPEDGTEITYLEYFVPNKRSLDDLVDSRPASVTFHDQFAELQNGKEKDLESCATVPAEQMKNATLRDSVL